MQKNQFRKFRRKKNPLGKPEEIKGLLESYMQSLGKPEQALLLKLWQHWDMAMGEYIANIAWPLGYKDGTLFVGGEDAISVQEISFMSMEIQDRANAFMEMDFFKEVKVRLSLDKAPLHEVAKPQNITTLPFAQGPKLSGKYLEDMPKDSPIARCYARFVERSKK